MRPKQITKKLYVDAGCLMIGDPCYYRADPNGVFDCTFDIDESGRIVKVTISLD